jgi:similar to stage IV sporulation protein
VFILTFLRYLRGYVVFSIRGAYVERFFNLAARNGIPVWNTFRRGDVFYGKTFAKSYRKLHKHARATGVRLRVAKKSGVPFKRRKYRKRIGLLLGFEIFFAFILLTSQFIWRVEVNGNNRVAESEIVAALDELGIKPGTLKASVDVRGAERRLLLELDRLSWVALNITGSAAYIEVRENEPPPQMVDPSVPCNIVAARSGQILDMLVMNGQPIKNIGDAVLQNEIVVSGVTQTSLGQNSFKHARARVMAQVEHRIEINTPYDQLVFQETGEIATRKYLRVFGWDFPLYPPFKIPAPYHAEREFKPFTLFGNELFSGIFTERYHLMREVPVTYSGYEAKALALRELGALEKAELPGAEILSKNMFSRSDGETYTLVADYICIMDIAAEKPILLSD